MTRPAELAVRLWPAPGSCRDARAALRTFCSDNGMSDVTDDALLITSELVANAVQHATGMVTMLALVAEESLVVAVRDDCDTLPTLSPAAPSAEGGRGMVVIDGLAGDWGVTRQTDGKTVWFRLP